MSTLQLAFLLGFERVQGGAATFERRRAFVDVFHCQWAGFFIIAVTESEFHHGRVDWDIVFLQRFFHDVDSTLLRLDFALFASNFSVEQFDRLMQIIDSASHFKFVSAPFQIRFALLVLGFHVFATPSMGF